MMRLAPRLAGLLALLGPIASAQVPDSDQARFFESRIRPVLIEKCLSCHGPDKVKGGLRLDSREAALQGGDSGPAIAPGQLDESLLLDAIGYEDDALKMPPKGKLSAAQVADFRQWVERGAYWPAGDDGAIRVGPLRVAETDRQHWAFQPVRRPEPPSVIDPDCVSPIDAFIRDGIARKGLKPAAEADRVALIRRVAFDLTGLPPTPEEVDRFVHDDAPDAYPKMVDRYLDSPHYGERWGRHWLDLVRFAETNSYERDNPKPNAWRYRDYVIHSFNDDKPYDRFIIEQIAGDELPGEDPDALIATGFHRLGIWDDEPTDREQARYDGLDDIVTTIGQTFLGLTIDCARCHDHKIDPIPQRDYYRLVAFLQNIQPYRNGGPTDERPLFESPRARQEYQAKVDALARRRNETQAAISAIERDFRDRLATGSVRDIEELSYRFYRDTWDRLPDFDALKPEESGKLDGGLIDLAPRSRDDAFGFVFEGFLIVPAEGRYTFRLDSDDGARIVLNGKEVLRYDGNHTLGSPQTATVEMSAGRVPIRVDYFQWRTEFGLRMSWSGPDFHDRPLTAGGDDHVKPEDLARRIQAEGARVLGDSRYAEYQSLVKQRETLRNERVPTENALVVSERGTEAPETFVLARGDAHSPTDRVEPGFPEVLGGEPAMYSPNTQARTCGRRLALARWIASPSNPLTARVMVNRLWQHHFGRGIVRSSSNFGLQGDKPTHPELLDWLASELVEQGWRLKPIHRLIVASRAYRMASRPDPATVQGDPLNDAISHFDIRRLSAEEVRDGILAVSGELNDRMYGPGIYPEIPPEVLAGQSMPGHGWGKSSPEEQARRSIYVHVKRSLLLPILEGFDVAETDRPSPVRFSTTQPTQALAMLNGAFLHRQAALLADRMCREAGDDLEAQVRRAWKLATSREPTADQAARAIRLMTELRNADGLSSEAARQAFALTVLNLNEFLYLD